MTQTTPGTMLERHRNLLALAGPTLVIAYGVLRLVDGRDGSHGPGLAWDVGHTAFLLSILAFAGLAWLLRDLAGPSRLTTAAAWATTLGAAAFEWVILGDLFEAVDEIAVPDLVFLLGPLLFQGGLLCLLVVLARQHRVLAVSPVIVVAGFVLIAVDLDLLPLAGLAILVGLLPVTGRTRWRLRTAG
jgi:hypothetical protein